VGGFSLKIEVECQSEAEAIEAIQAGTDVVMLDNFKPADLAAASKRLKVKYPSVLIEGSGGITEKTITDYFCPGNPNECCS
jgi:nicotinate-nucleotide pyrophosphorylase (carboxylating)